jgi:hypothetical protein
LDSLAFRDALNLIRQLRRENADVVRLHTISGGVKWRQTTVENKPILKSIIIAKVKLVVVLVFGRNLSPYAEH